MLRFNKGVSISLELTSAAETNAFLKGDLVRFYVDFRVTDLVIRGTLGIDSTA